MFEDFGMIVVGVTLTAETFVLISQLGYMFFPGRAPDCMLHTGEWARLEASHSYRHSRERLDAVEAVVRRLILWSVVMLFAVIPQAPHWASICIGIGIGLLELNFICAAWPLHKFKEEEFFFAPGSDKLG